MEAKAGAPCLLCRRSPRGAPRKCMVGELPVRKSFLPDQVMQRGLKRRSSARA
jgi:hypothetical protein